MDDIRFWYANGKMINQLDACHLEEDEVLQLQRCNKKTEEFI